MRALRHSRRDGRRGSTGRPRQEVRPMSQMSSHLAVPGATRSGSRHSGGRMSRTAGVAATGTRRWGIDPDRGRDELLPGDELIAGADRQPDLAAITDRRARRGASGRGSSRWAIGRGRLVQLRPGWTCAARARRRSFPSRQSIAVGDIDAGRARERLRGRPGRAGSSACPLHRRRHRRAADVAPLAIGIAGGTSASPSGWPRRGAILRHAGVVVRRDAGRSCSNRSTAGRPRLDRARPRRVRAAGPDDRACPARSWASACS